MENQEQLKEEENIKWKGKKWLKCEKHSTTRLG